MKKILGWRTKLLNNAEKEVLIKTVITTIPTYAMSVFQITKSWCKKINTIISRFWWRVSNGDRKIYWEKWETMTKLKKDGGFGFRELEFFDKAFLEKMAARIVMLPNTLWVRVLKSLYFPSTDFLQAVKGSRASWRWSSLLIRQNIVRSAGVSSQGDGKSIRAFMDQWILGLYEQLLETHLVTEAQA